MLAQSPTVVVRNGATSTGRRTPALLYGVRYLTGLLPTATKPRWPSPGRMLSLFTLTAATVSAACSSSDNVTAPSNGPWEYEITVGGDRFMVRAATAAVDSALTARWRSGAIGVITGMVRPTSAGFNDPWHWHLHPETVRTLDTAPATCGGTPSMVEMAMLGSGWSPGEFCPSNARVVNRHNQKSGTGH